MIGGQVGVGWIAGDVKTVYELDTKTNIIGKLDQLNQPLIEKNKNSNGFFVNNRIFYFGGSSKVNLLFNIDDVTYNWYYSNRFLPINPTNKPTKKPTNKPTKKPTNKPTNKPTKKKTNMSSNKKKTYKKTYKKIYT